MSLTRLVLGSMIGLVLVPARTVLADPFSTTSGNSKIDVYPGKPARYEIHNISPWSSDIRIVGRTHSDKNCMTDGLVNVDLIKSPSYGTVCTRVEDGATKFNDNGTAPKCLGIPGKFVTVYFQPFAGFVGTDAFEFTFDNTKGIVVTDANVALEIEPPSSGEMVSGDLAYGSTQPIGRVQLCPPMLN